MLADTFTPVSIYLKVRDKFNNPVLLESSDYQSKNNSYSLICLEPLAEFVLEKTLLRIKFPGEQALTKQIHLHSAMKELQVFIDSFDVENEFGFNGLFGYKTYDSVRCFEEIGLKENTDIPLINYRFYKFIILIDHFKNEMHLMENIMEDEADHLEALEHIINNRNFSTYGFELNENESSNFTDDEFLKIIKCAKLHCKRGDVFQLVLSRKFMQKFKGDEFNVYRALKAINPSPYLFFFDYGDFKLLGSSPEAQLVIKNNTAEIHPIAGTFKRTGNDIADAQLALKLKEDPKENAEHTMLVDLARNDLSRHLQKVNVEVYKEVQYYSHVIHLVSKVKAENVGDKSLKIIADTFPAGTLSGAPKFRAMQLIDKYEPDSRGYYGGAIGFLGFNGDYYHAIMIRTFLSKDNTLTCQAGCGIVAASEEENELQEVNNKLSALKLALINAQTIH